jgi:hypothetical protein
MGSEISTNWREMFIEAWWENVKKIVLLGKIKSRRLGKVLILNVWNRRVWSGLSWLNMTNAGI